MHTGIVLVLNQTARIDMQMKMGQVSGDGGSHWLGPVLQTERTEVSTIIDSNTNEALPLATRNYVQLTLLAPGAVTPNPGSFNNGDNTASGGRPYINGNREQANNFILDGMDNNQVSDNLVGFTPAPDAIQEFNLITQNASAEFGNYQGGIVSTTIKSGTNSFHGDLWEFFRNDKLNSNSWENRFNDNPELCCAGICSAAPSAAPSSRTSCSSSSTTRGSALTIPPRPSQSACLRRQSARATLRTSVRRVSTGSGVCNNLAHQLYDPLNANAPIANNNIAAIHPIDPVAQALFSSSLYPGATGLATQNNASYTQAQLINSNQYDIKIDFNATASDHVFGRYLALQAT